MKEKQLTIEERERIIGMVPDVITQKPIRFNIGDRKFKIKPPTLGMMMQIAKYCRRLTLDEVAFSKNPIAECMRLCEEHAEDAAMLMAVATVEKSDDAANSDIVEEGAKYFLHNSGIAQFANIIMAIFTLNDFRGFIGSIRWGAMQMQSDPTLPSENKIDRIEMLEDDLLGGGS